MFDTLTHLKILQQKSQTYFLKYGTELEKDLSKNDVCLTENEKHMREFENYWK